MVNTKHDTTSYESCSYQREIFNIEVLYDAFAKAKKGSDWKPQVQKFEMNLLTELVKLQKELKNRTFKLSPTNEFILNERGKTRVISGDHIRDRVVKKALCDEVLMPSIRRYLIHDNGASLKGKGIGFARKRLETHLRRYYLKNGSNKGYILLTDYTKFFDNIQHKKLMDMFREVVTDDTALWLLDLILKESRIDVSYMSDAEFADCLNKVFNSLDYKEIDKRLLTGKKYMEKHMNIGDQVAQVAGIFYPSKVDNYIKIVKGVKFFGRYMDDTYTIHKSREYLKNLAKEITEVARQFGITVNQRKTRICKLSEYWRFLQIQYSLTDTGRIIKKINPKRLSSMRRKLKKLAKILTVDDFANYYKAWFGGNYKIMSKQQRRNMNMLFKKLKEEHYV